MDVLHDTTRQQFYIEMEGKISFLDYRIQESGQILDLYHIYVPPALRGRNIAQEIVLSALKYVKDNHLKIVPSCPYVHQFIQSHPEFQPLLASSKSLDA